jgi:plasmid stability protein
VTITLSLPDAVHRALRVRAASHGRSIEAEVRAILESAVKPENRVRMGDVLAALGPAYAEGGD